MNNKYPKHINVDKIINPQKKKWSKGMCVSYLKLLESQIEINNMMCNN